MKVWHFSELAYPPAWEELGAQLRNVVPNRLCDPRIAADLYHRGLDEWALCDELGLNIMVNEHHATATCIDSVCTIPMAILAHETKKARLLCLGMPIGNRFDAVRVAEEYSMLDVISRGRVEMGFVKGAPFEVTPANSNPADLMTRFWEAHDLILKAMTTHDGPFNWEGRYFQYRQVNVWPRPYQQPHPPVWLTVNSPESAQVGGERGYVIGSLNTGYIRTPAIYAAYRKGAASQGREATRDRFAYMAIVGVGSRRGRLQARRPDSRLQPHGAARGRPVRLSARLSAGRRDGAGAEMARLRLGRRHAHHRAAQWPAGRPK
jgi:alkanesulfonate monooxygenase SsuD/methylene tetrahydromethanopterin reductase-like flavin-dependent oxidoreductase (luciferase family)